MADLVSQVEPKSLKVNQCRSQVPLDRRGPQACTFPGTAGKPTVVLVGDSNAGMYADGLFKSTRASGNPLVLATSAGCSLTVLEVKAGAASTNCLRLAHGALRWLKDQEPAIVVVASANVFVDQEGISLAAPGGRSADTTHEKARVWETSLYSAFRELRQAGHTVIQIRAIPHFVDEDLTAWRPSECNAFVLRWQFAECDQQMTLDRGNAMHAAGLQAEESAARSAEVHELDLRQSICPEGTCSMRAGDFWIYREGMHLSTGMSRRLSPELEAAIETAEKRWRAGR